MKTFKCKTCKEDKPESDFYVWKNGYRRKECNNCKRLKMKEYRHNNREHTNLTAKLSHNKARSERPESLLLYTAKQRAIDKGLPFNLKKEDISVPEFCPVLGIRLTPNIGGKTGTDNSPSLDRIIPELGYIKGNVMVISKKANTIKSFGTIEDHEKVVKYMKKHIV